MSLNARLILLFALLTMALLLGIGLPAYWQGREAIEAATTSGLESIANEKEAALQDWLQIERASIQAISRDPALVEAVWEFQRAASGESRIALARVLAELQPWVDTGQYRGLSVLDPETGDVSITTGAGSQAGLRDNLPAHGEAPWEPTVQPPAFTRRDGETVIYSYAPIHHPENGSLGVLAAQNDIDEIEAIVQRRTGTFDTDDIYLVNTENLFVTQPLLLSDPVVFREVIHTDPVERCLAGGRGSIEALDYRNEPVFSVYRWLPDFQLCLLVEIDEAEAVAPIERYGSALLGLGALVLIGAYGLAFGLARYISRPVRQMQTAAARFGEGDLSVRMREYSTPEFDLLANTFNHMATRIRANIDTLEDQVAARTAALQAEVEVRQRTEDKLRLLLSATEAVQSSPDFISALEGALEDLCTATPWIHAEAWLPGRGGETIAPGPVYAPNESHTDHFQRESLTYSFDVGEGLVGRVWAQRQPEWLTDASQASPDRFIRHKLAEESGLRTALAVPILSESEVLAVMVFYAGEVRAENQHMMDMVTAVASQLGTVMKRKRAEEALRSSEERYRTLFDSMPIGLFQSAPDGEILNANNALIRIMGYADRETYLQTSAVAQYADPEGRKRFQELLAEQDAVRNFEVQVRRRDGERRWVRLYARAMRDADGEIDHYEGAVVDVTETREIAAALRASEEQFRAVVQNSRDLINIIDAEGTFQYASPAYERTLGYLPADIEGNDAFELVHPEDVAALQARFMELNAAPGATLSARFRMRHKDGSWRFMDAMGTNLADHPGVRGIVTISRDVTDQVRYEEQLRASEERFRTVADYSYDWGYWINPEGKFVYVSPSSEQVTGYPPRAFEENPDLLQQIIHPDDRSKVIAHLEEESEKEGAHTVEFRILTRGGDVRWINHGCQSVYGQDGRWLGRRASQIDITARKAMEEAAKAREALLDTVLENLPVGVWITDERGEIQQGNAAGRSIWEGGAYVGPEDYGVYKGWRVDTGEPIQPGEWAVARAVSEGKTTINEEVQIECFDGSHKIILNSAIPLWEEGAIQGAVIVNHDVTLLKDAQKQLEQFNQELARSNQDLEQFAYVASHDLQEPLRMIASYLQLLERRYEDQLDQEAHEFIGYAVDGAGRMKKLINDLLAYSRVGTRGQDPEPIAVEPVLERVIRGLGMTIEETNATITYGRLPTVRADPNQLAQVFQNLISNAIKFRGEAPPQIEIRAERAEDQWIFSVQDNGIGIDPLYHDRIFIIFQRLHTRQEASGTGIGLAICKKIVERHGGRIWLDSRPGEGTTFHFSLPLERENDHAATIGTRPLTFRDPMHTGQEDREGALR